MAESNAEDRPAEGGTSMNPEQLRALADLTLIERYGLPPYLLGAAGVVGALVEELRYLAARHARLVQRFNVAAMSIAEQAGRVVEAVTGTGTLLPTRPALDPDDVTAVAEMSGRVRELHETLTRRVPVVVRQAYAAGCLPGEPVAADAGK